VAYLKKVSGDVHKWYALLSRERRTVCKSFISEQSLTGNASLASAEQKRNETPDICAERREDVP
jgi:hypothetical protein